MHNLIQYSCLNRSNQCVFYYFFILQDIEDVQRYPKCSGKNSVAGPEMSYEILRY